MSYTEHDSVLKKECLEYMTGPFIAQEGEKLFADLTFGGGGHTTALAELSENFNVVSTDQDPDALNNGQKIISQKGLDQRVDLFSMNFESFVEEIQKKSIFQKFGGLHGILMDLGVSSHHFDSPHRGFSYRFEGPLDMRMNPNDGSDSARDLINNLSEHELVEIFEKYGEEKLSKRIAALICEQRKTALIETTSELENLIFHCYPKKWRYGKTNPSTRVFQALRIAVNRELEVLESTLSRLPELLLTGGRLCVISFHSLEDRIVKHHFKKIARNEIEIEGEYKILTKKPILPGQEEMKMNRRSRSAKLRVIERQ